jgi:hypothetical protein
VTDFFDSGLWSAMQVGLQIFVVLLWLALVWWTYQDARRRTENAALIAGAVALSVLLPFLGTIIYLIIRPPEYMLEARERELELIALERRLGDMGDEEGQRIVGRILGREGPAGLGDPATMGMLRQAGVATRDELRDLDTRLTELEFRIRRASERAREAGGQQPRPETPEQGETGRAQIMRRMRRGVTPDPEATVE